MTLYEKQQEIFQSAFCLSEEDAISVLTAAGYKCRVVKRENESMLLTCDYNVSRANLTIREGIVIKITAG